MSKYAVDRIESGTAVLENIETLENTELSIKTLPEGVKEGDILSFINGEWIIEHIETGQRAKSARERFDRLKRKSPN